jgi:hypothetical protein
MNSEFQLIMISAGFEHGGNVTHRHFDGHPSLNVYPFESQLGNRFFNDFLASVERVQYRYPEFREGLSPEEAYEEIIDEEMKTFLRKRNGSKFRDADLQLSEEDRKKAFCDFLNEKGVNRKNIIEAFFVSTFLAWKNYYKNSQEQIYVGYSPAIGIDAARIIKDFPTVKIIHVIRNPFSAYRDTKRRPFPQSLDRYMITWNIYHSTANMYALQYPDNVFIVRYEEMVADKRKFFENLSKKLNIPFAEELLYPSWNGVELKNDIAPWGTVLRSTNDYNKEIINELSDDDKKFIANATYPLAAYFGYTNEEPYKSLYQRSE